MNKYIFNVFILIFFSVLASCSEEKVSEITEPVKSFSVIFDGGVVEGVIDHSSGTIQLLGISDGNLINDVSYELYDGAVFYPDPQSFIGVWDKEMSIVVRLGSEVKNYTIILPDYKEQTGIIHINPGRKAQKVEFIGGDMERSQAFLQKAANPEDVAQWCFGDVHFDICRVSYDKQQQMNESSANMGFYNNPIKSMKLLKKVNPNIKFWATLKSDYAGYNGENNMPEWIYDSKNKKFYPDKYARFLANYLKHMDNKGVHIDYMSVYKEWLQVVSYLEEITVIKEIKRICKEEKNIQPPLFVGPASWGLMQGVNFMKRIIEQGEEDLYYGFCTHNYGPEGKNYAYEKFVEAANSVNKFAFLDEEGPGSTFSSPTSTDPEKMDGVCGIYCRKAEFWKDGIQGELFFEVFSRDNKSKTRPVFFTDGGMAVRQRTYYVMKEYTNGISRKNMNYIPYSTEGINAGIGEGISFMAFANDSELFLVIVNPQDKSQSKVSVSLPEEYSLGKAVRTVFEINLPPEGVKDELEYADNSYIMDFPAKSVVFLSVSLQ